MSRPPADSLPPGLAPRVVAFCDELRREDIDKSMLEHTMSIIVKHRTDLDMVAERVGVKLTDGLIGRQSA